MLELYESIRLKMVQAVGENQLEGTRKQEKRDQEADPGNKISQKKKKFVGKTVSSFGENGVFYQKVCYLPI